MILETLTKTGRRFVQDSRHKASFTDRNGGLIASIGFVIMQAGKELQSDFYQTNEGTIGHVKAVSYAKELAGTDASKCVLVVTYGKEYAAATDDNNANTFTGSSPDVIRSLSKYFKPKNQ